MADVESKLSERVTHFSPYAAEKDLAHFGKSRDRRNQEEEKVNPHPPKTKVLRLCDTGTPGEVLRTPENDRNGSNGFSHFKEDFSDHTIESQNGGLNYALKLGNGCNQLPVEKRWEPRPDLATILDQITRGKLQAGTPIMTDILVDKNMCRVRLHNVRQLRKFAEDMKGNKTFRVLKTRPIRVELMGRDVKRLSSDKTVELEKSEQREIEKRIEADVVLKVFLNGCDYATDQFVSVSLSVVKRNEEEHKEEVRQNVLEEEWLIVSVYLKQPNTDDNAYRRDFKMKFSSALEKGEKGLLKFIDKKEFEKYIANDGSVAIGVRILFESMNSNNSNGPSSNNR